MSKKKRYFTLLLLSASLFGPSPTVVFAQHQVVIEAKSETLTSVLKRLERLSGYKMMYANDDVAGVKVSTSVKTTDVSKALDQILKGTGLTYTIDKQFVTIKKVPFVAASAPKGEAFIMQGHVYDESGLDVPGVTVMIVGTDKGTATDVDGRFSLKVRAGDKLKFSYIGYTNVIEEVRPVNNRKVMKVFIKPDSKSIDEVQVVAFGTQKKESVVSAITTVKPGDLKTSSSDLTTAFAGKIPGMIAWQTGGMPGALNESDMNTKFYVRGITSFQSGANTDPLILLDGVESSKLDLARIAVEDIESFSVLKDASATAMYGARGANGVIIVTTKKGTEGSVYTTMHYECVVSEPTRKIEVEDPINYMKYYNQALLGRSNTSSPKYTQERIARTGSPNYPSWLYPANDWYNILFKDRTINHRANLSIRGGSAKVQYYSSFNYNRDEGMLKSDKLNDFKVNIVDNQFNFRTNLTIELNAGIQLQINSATNIDRYHGPMVDQKSAYYYAFKASPVDFAPVYPADDTYNWPHIHFGTTAASAVNPYMLNQQGYIESRAVIMTTSSLQDPINTISAVMILRRVSTPSTPTVTMPSLQRRWSRAMTVTVPTPVPLLRAASTILQPGAARTRICTRPLSPVWHRSMSAPSRRSQVSSTVCHSATPLSPAVSLMVSKTAISWRPMLPTMARSVSPKSTDGASSPLWVVPGWHRQSLG